MENLKIKNFLVIKKADMKVNKLTLLIGHQSNGKSVIAKLLYFFREFIAKTYLKSIQNLESKKELVKKGQSDFEQYFPRYAWDDQDFELVYSHNDIEISIVHKNGKNTKKSTKLDFSNNLDLLHRKLRNAYQQKLNDFHQEKREQIMVRHNEDFNNLLKKYIYNTQLGDSFQYSRFIPASRSFFANLQKNIFSFLASDIEIDPFIKYFGSDYEFAKRVYNQSYFPGEDESQIKNKIDMYAESILSGKYRYENEQDWIESKNKRINMVNASSGQQEALPMLIMLSTWPLLESKNRRDTYFIEEPEAHLFPVSQKHIASIIALIYKIKHHNFVITTHSPYILTAFNNMILAGEVAKTFNEKKIEGIIDPDLSIDYNDVSAYTIKNGILETILDEETKLIGATVIDSVSDEFDKVFDSLLQLQLGE